MEYKDHDEFISGDNVFYCLYKSNRSELITVVHCQWFDMLDYDKDRFVKSSKGEVHRFFKERSAIKKMKEWYKDEEIDEEYRYNRYNNTAHLVKD